MKYKCLEKCKSLKSFIFINKSINISSLNDENLKDFHLLFIFTWTEKISNYLYLWFNTWTIYNWHYFKKFSKNRKFEIPLHWIQIYKWFESWKLFFKFNKILYFINIHKNESYLLLIVRKKYPEARFFRSFQSFGSIQLSKYRNDSSYPKNLIIFN